VAVKRLPDTLNGATRHAIPEKNILINANGHIHSYTYAEQGFGRSGNEPTTFLFALSLTL
jgi:hypothetical protein